MAYEYLGNPPPELAPPAGLSSLTKRRRRPPLGPICHTPARRSCCPALGPGKESRNPRWGWGSEVRVPPNGIEEDHSSALGGEVRRAPRWEAADALPVTCSARARCSGSLYASTRSPRRDRYLMSNRCRRLPSAIPSRAPRFSWGAMMAQSLTSTRPRRPRRGTRSAVAAASVSPAHSYDRNDSRTASEVAIPTWQRASLGPLRDRASPGWRRPAVRRSALDCVRASSSRGPQGQPSAHSTARGSPSRVLPRCTACCQRRVGARAGASVRGAAPASASAVLSRPPASRSAQAVPGSPPRRDRPPRTPRTGR